MKKYVIWPWNGAHRGGGGHNHQEGLWSITDISHPDDVKQRSRLPKHDNNTDKHVLWYFSRTSVVCQHQKQTVLPILNIRPHTRRNLSHSTVTLSSNPHTWKIQKGWIMSGQLVPSGMSSIEKVVATFGSSKMWQARPKIIYECTNKTASTVIR